MFESTIILFDRYCSNMGLQGISAELAAEVRERLQQMDYIVMKTRELETAHNNVWKRSSECLRAHVERVKNKGLDYEKEPLPEEATISKEEALLMGEMTFQIQLFTEAFYYFAARLRYILRLKSKPLPGLESFECVGIRNVRNKLIEHAERGEVTVTSRSFGHSGPRGPVIKPIRETAKVDIFPDAGLYPNAEEAKSVFEGLFNKALTKPEG